MEKLAIHQEQTHELIADFNLRFYLDFVAIRIGKVQFFKCVKFRHSFLFFF